MQVRPEKYYGNPETGLSWRAVVMRPGPVRMSLLLQGTVITHWRCLDGGKEAKPAGGVSAAGRCTQIRYFGRGLLRLTLLEGGWKKKGGGKERNRHWKVGTKLRGEREGKCTVA